MAEQVILGSSSPRRLELLGWLVGASRVRVVAPRVPDEKGFNDVTSLEAIDERLLEITQEKLRDVGSRIEPGLCVVAADTVIVGESEGGWEVLGKPPAEGWEETVREWFVRYYAGREHLAKTAVLLRTPEETRLAEVVTTRVRFRPDVMDDLDWYLSTGEPVGKAGGYGIQGAGSLFVAGIEGSLSNVVGLPLAETARLLRAAGVEVICR